MPVRPANPGRRTALLLAPMLAAVFSVAGCCNCDKFLGRKIDPEKLPPPISFSQQIMDLEANMLRIPRLRAEAAINGVAIEFVDDKGNRRNEHADGRLYLRQRFDQEARGGHDPADVRLVGLIFDRKVFEAGRNSDKWWFVMWEPLIEKSTAWVGDARLPVSFTSSQGPAVMRADVVPVLLGVSPWAVRPAPEEAVAMKVDDLEGNNIIMVFGPRNDIGNGMGARTGLRRETIVDRFTGRITEVRLYDARGVMVMRSLLSDYRPAEVQAAADEGSAPASTQPAAGPHVPYRVTLEYPARKMVIGLTFDRVMIPQRDVTYDSPEAGEDLRIVPVD